VHAPLAILALFALLAQATSTAAGRVVTLVLPHALRTGETAWIEVKVGAIERGMEIEITTTAGRSLGVISPYGVRSGREAGTYTVPLPADAISDDRVALRVLLNHDGHQRAPTAKEVKSIRVKVMPAGRSTPG
jgi:hypothetical protein